VKHAPSTKSMTSVYEREHFVQFYQTESTLLHNLKRFVGGGLKGGSPCLLILTPEHRAALEEQLREAGIDTSAAEQAGTYVALDAAETLSRFMRNDLPNKELFTQVIGGVLKQTTMHNLHARAFGEMVDLLWQQGNHDGAAMLEALWNDAARFYSFTLFCAYHTPTPVDLADDQPYNGVSRQHTSIVTL
jgi:hypothetical protein